MTNNLKDASFCLQAAIPINYLSQQNVFLETTDLVFIKTTWNFIQIFKSFLAGWLGIVLSSRFLLFYGQ